MHWGIVLTFLATTPPLVLYLALRNRRRANLVEWFVTVLCSAVLLGAACAPADHNADLAQIESTRPIENPSDGYVSSNECRACHAGSHETWRASYHRTMTQVAGPESVQAPFDGVTLDHGPDSIALSRRGDEFFATFAETSNSKPVERKIELTTGSHHFQVYWTAIGKGREIGIFPYTYQIAEKRWIVTDHLTLSDPKRVSLDSIWNRHCIQCHSTAGKPLLRNGSTTEVGEFGIACEACHGPAQRHVTLNRNPQRRYRLYLSGEADPSIVNPARLPHDRASEVCGQCHSVNTFHDAKPDVRYWSEHGYPYRPGDELAETRKVFHNDSQYSIAGESAFWDDDMARVNGREYNSLVKTPCFQRGELSCLSCHQLHQQADDPRDVKDWADDQLAEKMRGNGACLQCHERFANDEQLAQHTHHDAQSSGSRCYDCHMPNTSYGLHKATRSHQITSPSVSVELETRRPNACSLCHLDQPIAWAAQRLEAWYGIQAPEVNDAQRHLAAGVVWTLAADAGTRALAGWHMGWGPAQEASGTRWLPPYLAELLIDPYPAVRSVASRTLRVLPGYENLETPFEAERSDQIAAKQAVLDRWQATRDPAKAASYRLLMKKGEAIDESLFRKVRRHRDRRFVRLSE